MVRAYRLALVAGAPGEVYNLGSGRSVRIAEMIGDLTSMCRVQVEIRVDPLLLRPADIPRQVADVRKFTSLTGWRPLIPWHTTLADTLEYWRRRVASSQPSAVS
jgi:GDP-4-dehydro-6-deoxy-D-mannose reductase